MRYQLASVGLASPQLPQAHSAWGEVIGCGHLYVYVFVKKIVKSYVYTTYKSQVNVFSERCVKDAQDEEEFQQVATIYKSRQSNLQLAHPLRCFSVQDNN